MSDTLEELQEMVEDKTYLKFDSETEEKLIVGYFYKDRSTFLRLAEYLTTSNWENIRFLITGIYNFWLMPVMLIVVFTKKCPPRKLFIL